MEFGKGRMTLETDCFLKKRGGECGVLIGVLEIAPFVCLLFASVFDLDDTYGALFCGGNRDRDATMS